MSQPLVHVIVLSWKSRPHIEECFDSLVAGSYPNARFVLVDNASEDGSLEFVRTRYGGHPQVDIVPCDTNLGWSRGNNVGIERAIDAGADYVFLLNDDTVTAPDAIEKLVGTAEALPEIGALAPKMLLYDNPTIINSAGIECSIVGVGWDLGLGRLDGPKWNVPRQVLGVCGGACFLRTAALEKTGLLPTDFDMYLDDLDLCLRIWNAGYEIWNCPGAVVRHKFSATMGHGDAARRKYYLNTRNRLKIILRNFPWSKMPFVKVAWAIAETRAIGRAVLDGEFWRIAAHPAAWLHGAACLPRSVAVRRDNRRRGLGRCRFWPMIRKTPFFFPGVELPENGWYAKRAGTFRPISARAILPVETGSLRVKHTNRYPDLGSTDIDVSLDGTPVTALQTLDTDESLIEIPAPGILEFTARTIFDADDTGESIDIGGWLDVLDDLHR